MAHTMLFLKINEYVHCNTSGGENNHFWNDFVSWKAKNPSQVYQISLEGLQRFSHLPPDNVRGVFIYFRRFGPLNTLDSCEVVPRSGRQLLLSPQLLVFSLEKLFAYYCSSFCSPGYQKFVMVHDAHMVLKREEGSSFSVPSGKKQNAILSLLSTVRKVYYLHQHFQTG